MRVPDSWSFRQKPAGAFRRVLRIPVYLYRWRLGFLLGDRFLLLTHRGRRSGRTFQTPLEVVQHDSQTHEYIVCSGTGPNADWYRNLEDEPAPAIQVRNKCWIPRHRFLSDREAAQRFAGYESKHPRTARHLLELTGNSHDGTEAGRIAMMAHMPMLAFSDDGPPPASSAGS